MIQKAAKEKEDRPKWGPPFAFSRVRSAKEINKFLN